MGNGWEGMMGNRLEWWWDKGLLFLEGARWRLDTGKCWFENLPFATADWIRASWRTLTRGQVVVVVVGRNRLLCVSVSARGILQVSRKREQINQTAHQNNINRRYRWMWPVETAWREGWPSPVPGKEPQHNMAKDEHPQCPPWETQQAQEENTVLFNAVFNPKHKKTDCRRVLGKDRRCSSCPGLEVTAGGHVRRGAGMLANPRGDKWIRPH